VPPGTNEIGCGIGQPGVERGLLVRGVLGHHESYGSVELHEVLVQALRLSLYIGLNELSRERQQGRLCFIFITYRREQGL
jgi:hypothetical protein